MVLGVSCLVIWYVGPRLALFRTQEDFKMKPNRNVIENKGTVGGLMWGMVVALWVTSVSISGCSPDKKTVEKGTIGKNSPQNEAQAAAEVEAKPSGPLQRKDPEVKGMVSALSEGLTHELIVLPEPNAYEMRLKVNSKSDFRGMYKVFRSTDPDKEFTELVTLNWDQPEFIQSTSSEGENEALAYEQVEPGNLYYYRVQMLDSVTGTQNLTKDPMPIVFPKDFVFNDSAIALSALLKAFGSESNRVEVSGFNRVFLSAKTRIRVKEQSLVIVTNELVSNGGRIETFRSDDEAGVGEAGRNGGLILIQAKKAKGTLTLNIEGERGGQGVSGRKGRDGHPGARGADGRWGVNEGGGPRSANCEDYRGSLYGCSRPGDGGQGGNGENAGNGEKGQKGGDSGKLVVKISDVSEAKIIVDVKGGKGGLGGAPGVSGKGGAAGMPGEYLPKIDFNPLQAGYCRCDRGNAPHEGISGWDGQPGIAGLPGESGKPIEACLVLGDATPACANEVNW